MPLRFIKPVHRGHQTTVSVGSGAAINCISISFQFHLGFVGYIEVTQLKRTRISTNSPTRLLKILIVMQTEYLIAGLEINREIYIISI